jgi:hypothetical protein
MVGIIKITSYVGLKEGKWETSLLLVWDKKDVPKPALKNCTVYE